MAKKKSKKKKATKKTKKSKKAVSGAKSRVKRAKPKAKRKKAKRTTLYSSAGKKLYAVRDSSGKFKDIQTYKRAHGQDIKRKAKDEG